jgi:hypothetical protein
MKVNQNSDSLPILGGNKEVSHFLTDVSETTMDRYALVVLLALSVQAKPEIKTLNDVITLQAANGVQFSTQTSFASLNDILASISSNKMDAQTARDGLSTSTSNSINSLETAATQLSNALSSNQQSLETKLSSSIDNNQQQLSLALSSNVLSLQTVQTSLSTTISNVETSLSSAISSATISLDQQQSTDVQSLETVQTQLSGTMSTVEQGVSTTISTEVSALEKLLAASHFNLSISLNDTVKISELEVALSGAIAGNTLAIGDNGLADVLDRAILRSVSTQVVTDGRTLSSAVAAGNTAVNGVNNLTPRLSTAELSIVSLDKCLVT